MQGDDIYLQFCKTFYSTCESVRYMNMSGSRKCRLYKKYKCLQNSAVDGLEGVCTKSLDVSIWKSQKHYFRRVTREYVRDMTTDPSFRQRDIHKNEYLYSRFCCVVHFGALKLILIPFKDFEVVTFFGCVRTSRVTLKTS
jgi:hypothetical protein